jgi:Tfp pilus assembly protein PilO
MINGKSIFGAFTLAIACFFIWPSIVGSWQEMQALRTAVAEREQLKTKRDEILANVRTEYAKYTATMQSSAGRAFAELVPVKKDVAEIVSAVEDMATTSGIQLAEVRTNAESTKESDQYRTLALVLDMSGTYRSLRAFLGSLEQYVRVLDVRSIDVTSSTNTGTLRFSVHADAYFIQ